ncbi:Uncharacterised protein [Legionella wadsworthii]|uniref:DUF4238 domain-containing protein n=1 Tax=Legionella wadsworthii TaxID=28088 RepID=A0A378M1C9_9GAMM|nr:DUF4238 domain-containing protein [Legionella wadsworthii]STY30339.1 Uncharacterised protein [Legionella wadsworthii]
MTRHHYIPQFYLKKWINPKGYLHCYNVISDKLVSFQKKSTIDIGQVKNLYGDLEIKHYANLDGNAANIMVIIEEEIRYSKNALILLDDILSQDLRENFCQFLSSLTTRQQSDIIRAQRQVTQNVEELKRKWKWFPEANNEIEKFEKIAANEIIAARSGHASTYNKGIAINALPMLLNLKWYVIKFEDTKFDLLTSERPVCFFKPYKGPVKSVCIHLDDLLRNGYILSFALTPYSCFFASLIVGEPLNISNIVKFQNKLLFSNQPLEVYATSKLHEPLINKFLIRSKEVNLKYQDVY